MYSGNDDPMGRVSPFGNPRIDACSQLPVAYRSVPRPSSPLSAKASTRCPSTLDRRAVAYRGKPRERHASLTSAIFWLPQNCGRNGIHCWTQLPPLNPVGSDMQPIHDDKERTSAHDNHGQSRCVTAEFFSFTSDPRGVLHRVPVAGAIAGVPRSPARQMVELNGIEPMTSCLQSRRSPN